MGTVSSTSPPRPETVATNWTKLAVVGNLTSQDITNTRAEHPVQFACYIREIFGTQHNRYFVHASTLTNEYLDLPPRRRFGSERISITQDPKTFVDVVVGYGKMSLAELGYDPILTFDYFEMAGFPDTFTIEKTLMFWGRLSRVEVHTPCFDVTMVSDEEPP